MKLYKPNPEYIRGIVESIVSDYRENVENKNIQDVAVLEVEGMFSVAIYFPISESESDFENFRISPDNSIQSIREITEKSLNSIHPFIQSVHI